VFGWTIDEARSFEVLDAYARGGGAFIDTAGTYGRRRPSAADCSEALTVLLSTHLLPEATAV
jgi:aryl-alcohol dehydrogenase-like predicted oxidoreductase